MASSLSKAGVWNKLITQVNLGIFLSNNISIIYGLTTEMFWIYINLLHHSHFTLTVVAANFMPEVTLRWTSIQRGANTFLASRFMLQKLDKLWLYGPLARHNISLFVLNLLLWFGPWYQLAKQRLMSIWNLLFLVLCLHLYLESQGPPLHHPQLFANRKTWHHSEKK